MFDRVLTLTEVPIIKKPIHSFPLKNQWTGFYMTGTSFMKELNMPLKGFLKTKYTLHITVG